MRKSTKFILVAMAVFFSQIVTAQNQTISGKVTDATTGAPISGASVKVKSVSTVITGEDGSFSLDVPTGSVVLISIIGYADQTYKVSNATNVEIKMQPLTTDLAQVTMIGTRTPGRIKTESTVPIDVIKINEVGLPTAKMDLTSVLNVSAPSYNYNKQSGADGADHIDIGTLRGLGADHTLVLINGKRRHPTAFVGLFGTRGRGGSGVDMNGFPQAAVDRIEILRDGASAQYGSDAIAGVINIILKKEVNHLSVNAGWSGYADNKFNANKYNDNNDYYAGNSIDGNTLALSLNNGFALNKYGGFINYSFDFRKQGKTYRQAKVTDDYATNKDALPYANGGRRAFGDGSITTGGLMYNMELPTSATRKTTFYSFGGYNRKSSDAYAYSRNYSAKPERFPANADGSLIFVPSIMRQTKDGETYYNPHIQTHITDESFALGLKGIAGSDWNWDLSNSTGYNDFHYYGDKTFNASRVGQSAPNHFDDGGFNFLQNSTNLDFSKSFKSVAQGMNLGLGAEFRYEKYKIFQGEEASYKNFSTQELIYPNQIGVGHDPADSLRAPASGSQGFPGFSDKDVVSANRTNISVYADAEINITKEWLVDGAARFENYSDFGSVLIGKLATRYKVADNFNIRGSVSAGFRAPSLAQIHFSNTLTSFVNGALIESLISPNTSTIAKAAGIPQLKEEKSINASLGFTWRPAKGFTVTADGYVVKMKDRVVLSGLFYKDDATLPAEFTSQFPEGVSSAQFFANAVNTTNYGLDIVIDYTKKWGNNSLKLLLASNLQHINIDKINIPAALNNTPLQRKTFYSDREEAFLKASAPGSKFSLSTNYSTGSWGFNVGLTSFGKIKLLGFGDYSAPGDDNPNGSGINPRVPSDADGSYVPEVFNFNGKLTTDVSISYKISKHISVFVGADNVFNVHPNLGVNPLAKGWFGDNESGGPWDSVQMGFNGRRLFSKLSFNF